MALSLSSDCSLPTSPSPVPSAPWKSLRFQENWSGVLGFYKSAVPWVEWTETESPSIFLSLHSGASGDGGGGWIKALDAPRELSPGVLSACTVSYRAERLYGYGSVSVQLLQTFSIRTSMHSAHGAIYTLLPAIQKEKTLNERNGSY